MPGAGKTRGAEEDARLEMAIGHLLRGGVLLASGTVLVGGVLWLLQQHSGRADYRVFHSEPANVRAMGSMLHLVDGRNPTAIIQLGILLLIATPVVRVVLAAAGFLLERDRLYAGISFVVLAILAYSLIWGR